MRIFKLSLAAAAAVVLAVVVLTAGGSSGTRSGSSASTKVRTPADRDTSHERPTVVRSLAVSTAGEPAPTAHAQHMRALLLNGRLPSGVVKAQVLSDEDCAPDTDGVSHCRNKLRLPSGKTIEVRHPHRMHDVPCMTPGETVRVGRAAGV